MEGKKIQSLKGTSGFTLIELLIAITILVVIIAIMVALFAGNNGSAVANAQKYIDTGRQLAQAVELYYTKHNEMPTSIDNLTSDGELNSIPTDWSLISATDSSAVKFFGDSSKADDVVAYTGSKITKDICKYIVKSSQYYSAGSSTNNGMYAVSSDGSTVITDPSNCADGVKFYYLVRAYSGT